MSAIEVKTIDAFSPSIMRLGLGRYKNLSNNMPMLESNKELVSQSNKLTFKFSAIAFKLWGKKNLVAKKIIVESAPATTNTAPRIFQIATLLVSGS